MTEKRFTVKEFSTLDAMDSIDVICDNGIELPQSTVCDLLNKLQQRNKRLKEKIQRERVSFTKTHERWSKEAENKIKKLSNENEELKRELRTYRRVAGCFNCRYHNYDWYDDGDEFEVCDIGNDVIEGICEKWEEL